jgi:hypothetical protein
LGQIISRTIRAATNTGHKPAGISAHRSGGRYGVLRTFLFALTKKHLYLLNEHLKVQTQDASKVPPAYALGTLAPIVRRHRNRRT